MGNQILIINSSEASWDQALSFGISQLLIKFCLRYVADEYVMNVKLHPTPLWGGGGGGGRGCTRGVCIPRPNVFYLIPSPNYYYENQNICIMMQYMS